MSKALDRIDRARNNKHDPKYKNPVFDGKHSTEEYAKWDISKYKWANVTTHKEVMK